MACRPSVDLASGAQALLQTDRAWAAMSEAGQNIDSIVSFWTDDARVVEPGQPVVQGKAAIKKMVSGMLATPGVHVTWSPDSAVVSTGGDLGYTFGTNAVTVPDPKGNAVTEKGRYITVWRKEPDGRWRCVMDYGSPAPTEGPAQ
jgi:ketosteroid isomerase-like protein